MSLNNKNIAMMRKKDIQRTGEKFKRTGTGSWEPLR